MNDNETNIIDLREIFRILYKKKLVFFIVLPIVAVLSSIYIFSIPRYYYSETALAPEMETGGNTGGALGSLASNFGIDLGNGQTSDAIYPLLYPDLLSDNSFIVSLWNIKVSDAQDSIQTTYYDYLTNHQKSPWWAPAIGTVKKWFKSDDDDAASGSSKKLDPYRLSKAQDDIVNIIRSNLTISIDKQTNVITVSATDQDPLICKTLTDTLTNRLQAFITDYRTRKARVDVEYYQKLTDDAKREYEEIREKYVHSADANTDVILESVRAKVEDMENDMQQKYTTYTGLSTQLQAAKAKVQERTPAFTMIKGASVPIKPDGPKRMIFVAGMMFMAFICTALYLVRKPLLGL
ncbi:MAG: chain-length determining protein [Prevotella sp.]|nr:chain-length determining protein [Prevotella sp.]MBP3745472.1 chain-length determining protein [Prevotella sp.]